MKLLILSDVHYPNSKNDAFDIIKKENPDNLMLLGDTIDNSKSNKTIVELYEIFFDKVKKLIPINSVYAIVGDNDYSFSDEKKTLIFLNKLNLANKNKFLIKKGNMVFFHGNLETSLRQESIGKSILKTSKSFKLDILAILFLSLLIRTKFKISFSKYLFFGHLHYLGKINNKTYVCGTLSRDKIIYEKERSYGYIIIEHNNFIFKNFKIVKL
ncbi:MAG: metallophosphoesterase family protein [Candidatus Marsarchaeota archaeon]|nr:metallophosphoesterase family protein [Candidatus Marsarchaeota archaeon]MCL5094933.1 metallophosphoesterase family protein [Candidatus Marsarchaeota archaeon]